MAHGRSASELPLFPIRGWPILRSLGVAGLLLVAALFLPLPAVVAGRSDSRGSTGPLAPVSAPPGIERAALATEGPSGPSPPYHVAQTLVLPNDSLRAGAFAASNGLGPSAVVYDSGKGKLFVANTISNTLSVLNVTSGAIVGSVAVGPEPASLAYDPSEGTIYVANGSYQSVSTGQSSILAVNDTTYQGVAIPTGAEPNAVAYDPRNEEVFVANSGVNTVSVINATNDSLTATVAVPSSAWGIAYDPPLNEVIVDLSSDNSVSIIDASNLTLRMTVPVGIDPYVAASGPYGTVYVGNEGSNNITVLNGSTGKLIATIAVGSIPDALQYDPSNGEMYVANSNSNNLTIISTSRNLVEGSLPVGAGPDAIGLDPTAQSLFVADGSANAITWVNASTNTVGTTRVLGLESETEALDPEQGTLFIGEDGSDEVSVVNLTGPGMIANVSVPDEPTALAFDPVQDEMAVTESNGTDLALIDAQNATLVGQWAVGLDPDAVAYSSEAGEWIVANGGSGTVSILNATNGSLVANLTVGIYPDSIAVIPNGTTAFVANAYSDNVSVINLSDNRVTRSLPGGLYPSGIVYDPETQQILIADSLSGELEAWNLTGNTTSFTSVGLSPISLSVDTNTGVWVAIDEGSNSLAFVDAANHTILEDLSVGLDPTQVVFDPESGSIYVVNLDAASLMVVVPQLYPVVAQEFGLPNGTAWTMTIQGGPTVRSSTRSLTWNTTNGTYDYTVTSRYPNRIDPAPGTFVVAGGAYELSLLFQQPFGVVVNETGNPSGTPWWLNLSDGQSFESREPSLTFPEVNGTYGYIATSSDRGRAPVRGHLTVEGGAVFLSFVFEEQFPVTVLTFGLPSGAVWYWNVSGIGSQSESGPSASLVAVNGTYRYTAVAPGSGLTPLTGGFVVVGSPIVVTLRFVPMLYSVTFLARGLPEGTGWSIRFENGSSVGSNGSSLVLAQPNGSYVYTPAATLRSYGAPSGAYSVRGGPQVIEVNFTLPVYAVTFTPRGLPFGTSWWLRVGGAARQVSSGGAITDTLSNGTYGVVAGSANGSYSVPNYPLVVDGAPRTSPLLFQPVTFAVEWTARGIPNGTEWRVVISGRAFFTTHPNLATPLMNGSYTFEVEGPPMDRVEPRSGTITIVGAPWGVTLNFSAPPSPGGSTLSAVALPLSISIAVAGLLGAIWVYRRRTRAALSRRVVWEPPPSRP